MYQFLIKLLIAEIAEIKNLNNDENLLQSINSLGDVAKVNNEKPVTESGKYRIITARNIILLSVITAVFSCTLGVLWHSLTSKQQTTVTLSPRSLKGPLPTDIFAYHIPMRNSKFIGRTDAFDTINDKFESSQNGITIQVLAGSGGVGKTELATEYIYNSIESNRYNAVLWINANTLDDINSSYINLANILKIDTMNLNSSAIRKIVNNKLLLDFKASKVLFILDNVANEYEIRDYLQELNNQWLFVTKVDILITTRNQHWHNNLYLLGVFSKEEAENFIKHK